MKLISFLAEKLGVFTEIEDEIYIDAVDVAVVVYVLTSIALVAGMLYLIFTV